MFSSFASSLSSSLKGFVADVQFTVNAVLEDEKKQYEAEKERLEKKKKEKEEAEKKSQSKAVPLWTVGKNKTKS